jgi:hypothetical protein
LHQLQELPKPLHRTRSHQPQELELTNRTHQRQELKLKQQQVRQN